MASDLISNNLPPAPATDNSLPPAPRATTNAKSNSTRKFADELARNDNDTPRSRRDLPANNIKPGNAQTNKLNADDDAVRDVKEPKDLRALRKAALKDKNVVDYNPALAFLTGHMERLQPAQIPDLVTKNDFLTSAMVEIDLLAFMDKPAPLVDLLQALELPASLLQDAQQFGLDPNQNISPSELLKALGVDPQRVFAELKVLKDTAAATGFVPYMKRANAITGTPAKAATNTPANSDESQETDATAAELTAASALAASQAAAANQMRPQALTSNVGKMPSVKGGSLAGSPLATSSLNLGMPTANPAANTSLLKGDSLNPELLTASTNGSITSNLTNLSNQDPSVDLQASSQPLLNLSPQPAPSMQKASFDAFSLMGERLRADDVNTMLLAKSDATLNAGLSKQAQLDFSAVSAETGEDLLAAPLPEDISTLPLSAAEPKLSVLTADANFQQQIQALRLKAPTPTSGEQTAPHLLAQKSEVIAPYAGSIFSADYQNRSNDTAFDGANKLSFKTSDLGELSLDTSNGKFHARTIPVDDLHFADFQRDADRGSQDFLNQNKNQFGSDSQKGQGEKFNAPASLEANSIATDLPSRFAENLSPTSTHHTHGANPTAHAFNAEGPIGLTPEQRIQFMRQVVDRASILMQDRSGNVHIDFGTPELGKIELAMKLQDDKLDLRIMAGSDRAREIMVAELNRLRDALAVQNVQLGQVEVGVGQRERGFAGFTGQQGQQQSQQRQGFEDSFRAPLRPLTKSLDLMRAPRLAPLNNNIAAEPGKIEIRI